MEMDEKYFVAKITTDIVDSESGKVKKQKEEKLVRGYNPTDASKEGFPSFFVLPSIYGI